MNHIKIITTHDGSHSLLHETLDETYHSRHGAAQESQYVFLQNGLDHYINLFHPEKISVLEIGFGTGLNALLTAQYAVHHNLSIEYTTLEPFPLEEPIWQSLNYVSHDSTFENLHRALWDGSVFINEYFTLLKKKISLQEMAWSSPEFDVVYFDAFAPNKQPEMWEVVQLEKVVAALVPKGLFVTYCAKGQLKRDLKSLGLTVESLPGPPGKREMVRAIKNRQQTNSF